VLTALRRRAPHVPVWLAPASVQGADAPCSLIAALQQMYDAVLVQESTQVAQYSGPDIDVILLVRGGGSLEDLWAFNDEQLAHAIARSPVPLVSGVGHETDFSIADFVADLRAPTPTAAAELASPAREALLGDLQARQARLGHALERRLQQHAQRLDATAARLARPAQWLHAQRLRLADGQARLGHTLVRRREREAQALDQLERRLSQAAVRQVGQAREHTQRLGETLRTAQRRELLRQDERLARMALRLDLLDPQRVLDRGYSLLLGDAGRVLSRVDQLRPGTPVRARVSDGSVDLTVTQPRLL
jgi:exodeoxyribonuclease VII large subunit